MWQDFLGAEKLAVHLEDGVTLDRVHRFRCALRAVQRYETASIVSSFLMLTRAAR